MKNICDLLKEHIENSGYTIYSFANRSKINRTTLQKILSGDRTLNQETLQQIIDYLPLTPNEFTELQTAFLIYTIGESRYHDRMYIKDFLEWHSSVFFSYASIFQDRKPLKAEHPLMNTESQLLAGRGTLIQALYMLLHNSPYQCHQLCTYSLFHKDFFYDLSNMVSQLPNKEIQLEHLFAVDKATQEHKGSYYNLNLFTNMIPYILQNFNNSTFRYYYGNIAAFDPDGIFFPYFILLEDAVILTSSNFETSLYLSSPDIVSYYTTHFRRMYNVSLSFTHNTISAIHFLNYAVDTFTPPELYHCIENQPSPLILLDAEILEHVLRKDILNRDTILKQIHIYQKNMQSQQGIFYFTRSGLDLFARNGIYSELKSYTTKPFSVDDRIHILNKILAHNKQGAQKYIMINERYLNPNPHFSLAIKEPNTTIIQIKHDNGDTRFCEFHENTLYDAFLDFFTSMPLHQFALSLEETNTYIRQLIKELK